MKSSLSESINEQMRKMRFDEKMTLQEIADEYGITREAVRQRIGNTGYDLFTERVKRKWEGLAGLVEKTNTEIEKMGVNLSKNFYKERAKLRHAIDGGSVEVGTQAEIIISNKLKGLGIENELMPHQHTFDILLANGKRVDVKSRTKRTLPPSMARKLKNGGQFRFDIRTSRRGEYADFFVLYLWETSDCFIIPIDATTGDQIVFSWPPSSKSSQWHKYHNRFDLLKDS